MLSALLLLSLMSAAPDVFLNRVIDPGAVNDTGGSLVRQLAFTLLLAAIVGLAAAGHVRLRSYVPMVLLPILAWAWFSLAWAIDPAVAFRRILFTTITIVSVGCLVQMLSYRRCVNVLVATLGVILLVDWVSVVVFPLAVHQAADMVYQAGDVDADLVSYWRGIHLEKNEAGAFCALCFIFWSHEAVRLRSYLTGLAMSVLAAAFLYQTHSKTSGGFVLVSILVGAFVHCAYHSPRLRRGALLAVSVGVLLLAYEWRPLELYVTAIFDDPSSFTGRVQIWPVLVDFASDHFLLGSGFGSFWGLGGDSPIYRYGSGWITHLYEAHNGYLEILIQLGAIGLFIAVATMVVIPFRRLFLTPLPPEISRSLIGSVIAFQCLHDLLEASLLDRANPLWVITLITLAILFKHPSDRSRTHPGP